MSEMHGVTTRLKSFEEEMWSNILPIPNSIAEKLIEGKDRRVICHISGIRPFHCAILPDGEGSWFILLNKARKKALGVRNGDEIAIQLEKDRSEYGMEMPVELREVLDQDEYADKLFHELTPGRMRNIIHSVASVKSSDIKIRRAFVYAEHLKKNKGKIEYKALSQEMKEANRQAREFPS